MKRLGLQEKVLFAGKQYNIRSWLSAFDLFLFPSLFEGLSIAALEAQANGIPVLASDGVIPEKAKVNDNFLFFSLNHSASDWAKEIQKLHQNEAREPFATVKENFVSHGFEIKNEADKLQKMLLGE